jgi:hypothetical protein
LRPPFFVDFLDLVDFFFAVALPFFLPVFLLVFLAGFLAAFFFPFAARGATLSNAGSAVRVPRSVASSVNACMLTTEHE